MTYPGRARQRPVRVQTDGGAAGALRCRTTDVVPAAARTPVLLAEPPFRPG